jgi:small subunit ribosomal protein S1
MSEESKEQIEQEVPAESEAAVAVVEKENIDEEEVIVKLQDLTVEEEYPLQERQFLTQMYEKTLIKIKEGDIVPGKILDITDKEVIVDIGFKSEGIMPIEEFDNLDALKVGDEVEVYLETLENLSGQLSLSRRRADFIRVWESVVSKYEKDETINGTISRRIKGGMVVNLNGVDAFLPGSQIDVKPIRDFDSYLGRELEFKIVKVNYARRNIVVSSRILIEKELASQRSEIIGTIEKGQVRKGTVKNITDFGIFIDLGGLDGLLHITDLSWGRVNHPSEVVKLDEEIEVIILDYNENKDRISLGRKQLMPHPWEKIDEKYPVASTVKGKVVSITDYGAFVELENGIEGLIHISEMSWSQHIKHPSQVLNVGQEIEAKVLNIESDEKKISLGLKQLEPDPWENIEDKYPTDSHHKGIVRNLTQFGAFVELEEGIDGLVHISDLSWTKKIRHPSEVVKKNDSIEVVVLGINRDERRIALGHKQIDTNPWDAFEDTYKVSTETKGTISRIIDKGVIVTLPLGVDGFIPMNHLGYPRLKKISDVYKVDDEIPAKIIEFDKENKKIVLSVTEYFKDRERNDWEDYLAKQGVETNTIEKIVKQVPDLDKKKKQAAADPASDAKKSEPEVVKEEKTEKKVKAAEEKPKPEEKKEEKKEPEKAKVEDKKEPEKAKVEDKKEPEEAKVEDKKAEDKKSEKKDEKPEKAEKEAKTEKKSAKK